MKNPQVKSYSVMKIERFPQKSEQKKPKKSQKPKKQKKPKKSQKS